MKFCIIGLINEFGDEVFRFKLKRTKENIMVNKQGGYLLRTKKVGTDEGGVATGYSVLDSPFLVE